jgi:predicted ester cyclase
MLPEERKALARLAHEAINQRNLVLLADHPGYWQTRQVFPQLFTAFPDASSTVEQQTVEGAWVTTRTTLRGTHRGAFMGVAPTGKAIEIMNISLDQVEDGKVVEHFGVSDWLRALIVFEIVAAPAAVTSEAAR